MEEDQTCWICLCGADGLDTGEDDQVVRVCDCPRVCHKRCLGRWQLQNAGKREEKYCRFCQKRYPDWRNSLTPGEITPSTPVMAVSVRGKVYKLRVRSGPEGKEDFKRQIRQLLGFTQDMDFDVIFECKTPHNGSEKVQLHGFEAFEAASWCAAVSAAKRKKAKQEAAARAAAAAAAAAAACAGSLTPTTSCPPALGTPSSNGVSATGSNSSDGSCVSHAVEPSADAVHSTTHHDADTSIAPSAFATATATASAAVMGCPARTSPLLGSSASEPSALLPTSSSTLGLFGLCPASAHMLQPADSSLPHATVAERPSALTSAASNPSHAQHAGAHNRRSSSCPGEASPRTHAPASSSRASYTSGLHTTAVSSRVTESSAGDDGGEGGRGKVGRWLRRVLHLDGTWKAAVPAGVFMGVV